MPLETIRQQLKDYVPAEAVDVVARWIVDFRIEFTVTANRKSLYGDYRWPQQGKGHRISVNGDLNPYAFFITIVHEMAHLTTWVRYRNSVPSHGREWKLEFKMLMDSFSGRRIFPASVRDAFRQHLDAPRYTHCTDVQLMKALKKFDSHRALHVEDLESGACFEYNKRLFTKGACLRKRIRCTETGTGRTWLFNPLAEIRKIG